MLNYSYPLFRPPAEANNIILQITHGCSHNNCSFCSMYKFKKYGLRDLKDIFKDIDILAAHYPGAIKVFLADGDPFGIDTNILVEILHYLKKQFPKLRRVSTYATAQNILAKSQEELELLSANQLNLLYFGIETGSDTLLKKINKGVTSDDIITALNIASQSSIKISATVILGLGGTLYSQEHTEATAKIVNNTTVNYLSTLQLGLEDDLKSKFYNRFESFKHLSDLEILQEQKELIQKLSPKNKVIFRSNHASNALHLSGTLPKDKQKLLYEIDEALNLGDDALVPKIYRGF